MKKYSEMTAQELEQLKKELSAKYKEYQAKDLKLNMARGKPCVEQLNISMGMMDVLSSDDDLTCDDGTDCRNYGVLDGVHEAKVLLADMMEVGIDNVIVYGNSSLNVMYDTIARSMTHGVMGSTPWCKLDKVKFLCPVPGYDRHFKITEYFGIEMINVPMTKDGPDMDMVEKLVSEDESIKGIWCVPKYSNPQGYSYSDEVVRRMARLEPKANDFRIYWDNAYTVHHLYDDDQDELIEILDECKKAGNPDMVYKFASTSKISFPGSGVSVLASSLNNLQDIKKQLTVQTIGHDKVNQLRHVLYLKNKAHTIEIMKRHASVMAPKFCTVLDMLDKEIAHCGFAHWNRPKGGYFVSLFTMKGTAKRALELCKEAGVVMTSAGATYPYGIDPDDSNIRIAPSLPPVADLEKAMEVFCVCLKLAAVEKLLDA